MFLMYHNGSCAAYMSNPCHIELILSEKEEPVKKEVKKEVSTYEMLIASPSGVCILVTLLRFILVFEFLVVQAESQIATRKA
jgi:hypothetical protein